MAAIRCYQLDSKLLSLYAYRRFIFVALINRFPIFHATNRGQSTTSDNILRIRYCVVVLGTCVGWPWLIARSLFGAIEVSQNLILCS
jgi:hypothetical protein